MKVDGRAREVAKLRVIRGYDSAIIRAYCSSRFGIRHQRFLDEIGQYLPSGGRVLDLSCGFSLLSLYYANVLPNLYQDGLDRNSRRIATACRAAERLGVHNVTYNQGDVMAARSYLDLAERGAKYLSYTLVLDDNWPSRRTGEKLGAYVCANYVTYRRNFRR